MKVASPLRKILTVNKLLMDKKVRKFLQEFENFLKATFHLKVLPFRAHQKLLKSIHYTLFSNGKRFRPLLIFSVAEICQIQLKVILPWASAIEVIHTASLIHDDLPIMDNSRIRRAKAANHRLFGEEIAMLAGNTLWIEAFRILATYKKTNWVKLLSEATGFNGLMGGQALDMMPEPSMLYYTKMHELKTAALIIAAIRGVLSMKQKKLEGLYRAAPAIGRAFQLADDLKDEAENKKSNITFLDKNQAKTELKSLSKQSLKNIAIYPKSSYLKQLILFNMQRAGVK